MGTVYVAFYMDIEEKKTKRKSPKGRGTLAMLLDHLEVLWFNPYARLFLLRVIHNDKPMKPYLTYDECMRGGFPMLPQSSESKWTLSLYGKDRQSEQLDHGCSRERCPYC